MAGRVHKKAIQPGYALLVAIALFLLDKALPTTGQAGRDVHVAIVIAAWVFGLFAIGWLIVPWGLPTDEPRQPLAELDPETGRTEVYGGDGRQTSASVLPIGGGGWAIHAEQSGEPSPLVRRFIGRSSPGENVFAQEDYHDLSKEYGWHKPLPEDGCAK